MNTATKTLTISTLLLLVTSTTYAATFEATNNYVTTQICIAAAEGHRARLYKTIQESGLSKSFVTNKVKCNNQNITAFVAKHGRSPDAINNMLNKYRKDKNTNHGSLAKL